jgi:hypothetical protein
VCYLYRGTPLSLEEKTPRIIILDKSLSHLFLKPYV